MIVNGSIQVLENPDSGLDDNGDPISVDPNWGESIICQIKTVKHDYKGIYTDGFFERASYEILFEMREFSAEKVLLQNSRAQILGEFKVQDIQFLDLVQRVKIVV